MAGLLALVAHALLGRLCGAVARKMTNLATARVTLSATFFHQVSGQNNSLVALLALGAVAAHVAETAAGVAGLLALLTVATGTGTATNGLGALAGDVTDFTACEKVWSAKITRLKKELNQVMTSEAKMGRDIHW